VDAEYRTFLHLGASLAIGLLIGLERGWQKREAREGARVAGLRTYGLIGLLGGGTALLVDRFGSVLPGLVFIGVAAVLATAYVANLRRTEDAGITSLVAALLVFILGALAGIGEVALAAAAAVVATLLLGYKPELHRWVSALEPDELHSALKLLLISVVLLPILPNRGYGPWDALNPYAIWWMVVLIACISFSGYFAMKIGGARRGVVFTGLFAGLASSTALALHFSRLARRDPSLAAVLSAGILLACGMMFLRMVIVSGVISASLSARLAIPALAMALLVGAAAAFHWRSSGGQVAGGTPLRNPLELRSAIGFGALLAVVMLLAHGLQYLAGDAGIYLLAAASGIADVDAITLSLARMQQSDLALSAAVTGIVIAASVNNLAKAVLAAAIGGREVAIRVAPALVASSAAGLLSVWFLLWR
jgi:uncharacterized membrane protein (DUF4010 family)